MSTQIDLGPVLSIPKGDWNADTTYERLNMVRHNSASWICNVTTSKGVEPTEDSTDWYLQVKDTSSVTSVNGMRGDVEITTIQTPSNDSNDTSIANTEWVRGRITETLNSAHSYTDNAISTATTSILDTAAQDAYNKATVAVNQALAASETKFATKEVASNLADDISVLTKNNATQDAAIAAAKNSAEAASSAASSAASAANSRISNATIDGLDLVLTYGNGTTKRVPLPTGKGVGDMWFGVDPKSKPANVQAYSGQLLSRSAYPAHWAFVNGGNRTVISESQWQAQVSANGFCPYYSSGDGSTTYRMPSLKGVHPKFVAALAEAGGYTAAGLPNITGYTGYGRDQNDYSSGPFYRSGTGKQVGQFYGSTTSHAAYIFDASLSNPIYGKSTTVQPPAVNIILGEYVVGSVAAIGEANATSLLASVTRLESGVGALESGSGFNAAGKAAVVGWGMPDYSAAISVIVNGTLSSNYTYTAPSNGYLMFRILAWADTHQQLYVNNAKIYDAVASYNGYDASPTMCIPMSKGDVFKVGYYAGASHSIVFVPLKGA